MRVKPLVTFMPASGVSGVAYSCKAKLMSLLPFGRQNRNQGSISNRSLSMAAVRQFTAPKIDLSHDRLDLFNKHLSLDDLEELNTEVQNNDFIGHIIWGTFPPGEEAHTLRTSIEQKIIQNNQNYRRYPSNFIQGLLSLHAYQTSREIDIPVTFEKVEYHDYEPRLAQWRINSIHDLPQYGQYYAASYYNKEARQLVLAHRGTTATWSDLWNSNSPLKTDLIGVLAGEIVDQQKAAYAVTKSVATFAKENHYHFSTTGHSLGAWLAELSLYWTVFDFNIPAKAVTFDSPGSIKMKNFRSGIANPQNHREIEDLDITTYLSDPNFVNTCHRHVGQVYRLFPEYKKPAIPGNKILKFLNHPGFQSIRGHSLAPLVATFDPTTGKPYPGKVKQMARWPVMTYKPLDSTAHNIITDTFARADDPDQASLFSRLISFAGDVWSGRIDQKQYLSCWEQLTKPLDENATIEERAFAEFTFKYKSNYEFLLQDPRNAQLMDHRKGSADWYLKKLYECPIEKISQEFGEDGLITQQLLALKKQYTITFENNRYQLTATDGLTVEVIREHLSRLLDPHVTQGEVGGFFESHQQSPWVQAPELKLASYLPLSLGSQYILRADDFDQIDQILTDHPYAIICGEPGFGKSSLAMEYGHRQESRPQNSCIVFTIAADSPEKIDAAYRTMAIQMGIRTEQENAETIRLLVHSQINTSQKKVLLIFDNVEKAEHIEPLLSHLPKNIKALITTRHSRLIEGVQVVRVRPFSHLEAKQYIESSAIKGRITDEKELEALIAYYAKGTDAVIPYHLNRAIGIIKQKPIGSIKHYLDVVKDHPDDEGEVLLQQQLMVKSQHAWSMLQYSAFLDPDFVDLSIFEQIFHVDRNSLVDAICTLESLSAMHVVRREGQEGLALHRLTQNIVHQFLLTPSHHAICMAKTQIQEQVAQSLNNLCPKVNSTLGQNWEQAKKLMPHIETVLNHMQETESSTIAELWDKNGEYTREWGLYKKSLEQHKKALAIWRKLYPNPAKPHPNLADSLMQTGLSYLYLAGKTRAEKGVTLLQESLEMKAKLYSEQSSTDRLHALAESCDYLGFAYVNSHKPENIATGLALQKKALAIWEELYQDQDKLHPNIAQSLNNIGYAYEIWGGSENIKEALGFHEKALTMRKALSSDQPHKKTVQSLNNIARCNINLGKPEAGLTLAVKALTMSQTLYQGQLHPDITQVVDQDWSHQVEETKIYYQGQPHPDIAKSLYYIGKAYRALNQPKKARAFYEHALAMRQELYSNLPYPEIIESLRDMGKLLINQGQLKKGESYLKQAEEMQQKLDKERL